MNCPRCIGGGGGGTSPYRGEVKHGSVVALVEERHAKANVTISRCTSCRGAFAEYEALIAIETAGREKKRSVAAGAARRGYDPPTEKMGCPSCSGETTRREWSIGTLLFVDVCIECRGVWLDGGELEAIGG